MPVNPLPKDNMTYLLVKVDTDQDIERIVGAIETIEHSIGALTRLDVIQVNTVSKETDDYEGSPVIYRP